MQVSNHSSTLFSPFTHPHIHPSISPSVTSSVHPSIHLTMQLPTHPPNHLPTQPKIRSLRAKGDHAHKFTDIVHRTFHFRFFYNTLFGTVRTVKSRTMSSMCTYGAKRRMHTESLLCLFIYTLLSDTSSVTQTI
jgi:hypothetical protein